MIDWHSHILPGMDDGSKNVAESIAMLNKQASQGIKTVVATPHFYANDETVDSFLKRRAVSHDSLRKEIPEFPINLLLGAEVRYYQGISRMQDLKKLKIEGSKVLLLEMPFCQWTEYMIRDLIELTRIGGLQIVLAHIERYQSLQKKSDWLRIAESGILMQVNASYFRSLFTRRKAISLLENGGIHFLGSDCHNMAERPPLLGDACDIIKKKLGEEFLFQMNAFGHSMFVQ